MIRTVRPSTRGAGPDAKTCIRHITASPQRPSRPRRTDRAISICEADRPASLPRTHLSTRARTRRFSSRTPASRMTGAAQSEEGRYVIVEGRRARGEPTPSQRQERGPARAVIVHRYTDNDVSASKRSVVRPDFQAMLRDLRRGQTPEGYPVPGIICVALFDAGAVKMTYHSYRGTKIPSPWLSTARERPDESLGLVEHPLRGNAHDGCGRRLGETHRRKRRRAPPGRPHLVPTRDRSTAEHSKNHRHSTVGQLRRISVPGTVSRPAKRPRSGSVRRSRQ